MGFDHTVTVEAQDSDGFRATAYGGTVVFSAPGGTEIPDTDDTVDDVHGLPKTYTFTSADAGIHTFTTSVRFRLASVRQLRVEDAVHPAIFGIHPSITVNPGPTVGLLVVPAGETYAPGQSPAPTGKGVTGTPTPKFAGNIITAGIKAVDQ